MRIHLADPWNFSINNTEYAVLVFVIIFMIYVAFSMIKKDFTQRQNLVISTYAISLFSSMFYLIFYWYIALLMSIIVWIVTQKVYRFSINKIEKDEKFGLNAMSLSKIEEQRKQWNLKTEQEKVVYLESYKRLVSKWHLNYRLNFLLIFLAPILLVLTLLLLRFSYNLY